MKTYFILTNLGELQPWKRGKHVNDKQPTTLVTSRGTGMKLASVFAVTSVANGWDKKITGHGVWNPDVSHGSVNHIFSVIIVQLK